MITTDGRLKVVAGASRSGKTAWVKKDIEASKAGRVFAWDPECQWAELPGWQKVTTRPELIAAAKRPGPCRVAYVAGGKLAVGFDFWAGCVMAAGRYVEPVAVIAEELADVTTTAKAPEKWGILLRRGLKRGITIYAISQRWAEADKTAVGNASEFIMFRMSSGDDVAYMARKTKLKVEELAGLKTVFWPETEDVKETFFVKVSCLTGNIERGSLRFPRRKAAKTRM